MLTTLRIKNLALVSDLAVEFQPGYNVITGETGAGKSILIGALNLVLGERADRNLIRTECDSCTVEAVFAVGPLGKALDELLQENGLEACEDGNVFLKRTFTVAGSNRQFINGTPTTLGVLACAGQLLVDIHGPHEHQSLLHPARQLAILDAYGKLDVLRESFAALVRRRSALEGQKAELIIDERAYAHRLDLLRFQVAEIEAARLDPGEEIRVEQDFQRASNAARLLQLSQVVLDAISEQETSLVSQAGAVGRAINELQRLDEAAAPLLAMHEQAMGQIQELQNAISRYADKLEVDPGLVRQLEERLNLIHSLKHKYGSSLLDVLAFGEEARQKLFDLEQREGVLARIEADLRELDIALWKTGKTLSLRRHDLVPRLCRAVEKQLADLGFKQSRFDIGISSQRESNGVPTVAAGTPARFGLDGLDTVEFQFAPNPGEPAKPLRSIASSGEMARVMLALKTVLAAEDSVPVLVFDEVDANVGGETAHVVGEKMRQIARQRQVLCITHLPQVAAPAVTHWLASKEVREGRSITRIERLGAKERITELARMLGGQSEAARKHAQALLR